MILSSNSKRASSAASEASGEDDEDFTEITIETPTDPVKTTKPSSKSQVLLSHCHCLCSVYICTKVIGKLILVLALLHIYFFMSCSTAMVIL